MKTDVYTNAREKALSWLLSQMREDASFAVDEGNLRCYSKASIAFLYGGQPQAAHWSLEYLKHRFFTAEGDFRTDESYKMSSYNRKGERLRYLYHNGWAATGAHLNGRFDISFPAMRYILTFQNESGGFYSFRKRDFPQDEPSTDITSTASATMALLYGGFINEVQKAGDYLLDIYNSQRDKNVFYLYRNTEGELVEKLTGFEEEDVAINNRKPKQLFWTLGFASSVLTSIYRATGEDKYLKGARDYLDFIRGEENDSAASFGCWKVGWAAANLYQVTHERALIELCSEVLDYIVKNQREEGFFPFSDLSDLEAQNTPMTYDLTSEMVIWLSYLPLLLTSSKL